MRHIQKELPEPRHTEVHRIFVSASPAKAWEMARHFDMAEIPWIRMLFDVRTLPSRLAGHPAETDKRLGVDQIADNNTGFMILYEEPGTEVVIGSVGQFWHLHIPFASVSPEAFKGFNEPGWGKLAWSIRVEPYLSGATISLELRTTATDDESWGKLNRYYHLIGIGSQLIRGSVMKHLEAALGKMKFSDESTAFPGDEILRGAKYHITQHTNIEAPVHIVWRYLMQLGCDRAGWYSIDALDNDGKASIDHLVGGWEKREPGERIAADPEMTTFFHVHQVVEQSHFIIGGELERMGGPFRMTWAFILNPVGEDATHLVSRTRMISSPRWAEWFMGKVLYPPLHGLMSGVQLGNIKRLAERDALIRMEEEEIAVYENK